MTTVEKQSFESVGLLSVLPVEGRATLVLAIRNSNPTPKMMNTINHDPKITTNMGGLLSLLLQNTTSILSTSY